MVAGSRPRRPKGTGSIRERGRGRWQLRVYAGTDPLTGRPRLAEKTVVAKNETEARQQLREFAREQDKGAQPGTSAALATVLEEWLRHTEAMGNSPRTIHEARRTIDTVLVPALGSVPVRDLTARHLDVLYRQLLTGEGRPRPLAASTVIRYHAVLRAALRQAVKWGWIEKSPAEQATLPRPDQPSLVVPTTDEVRRLIDAARARSERWGVLVGLAVATGARRGELCALRWPAVEDDLVRVRRSVYRAGDQRGEKSTKGRRERWVPITAAVAALLAGWRKWCEAEAERVGVTLVPDAFVVSPLPDGSKPVNPDTFSSTVYKLCRELGMPHVHLHSLRHYAVTELIGEGVDPRTVAEVIGHASPGFTLARYAHATAERQRAAAAVLGRALMPGESTPDATKPPAEAGGTS